MLPPRLLCGAAVISLVACSDNPVAPVRVPVQFPSAAGTAVADLASGPTSPNFNLEAILRAPDNSGGFGHVKFRQDNDAAQIIDLDVWVRDLAPNHSYRLQRATDGVVDDDCAGTNWLTLGQGTTPQAILTDDKGTGRVDLFRDLSAIPAGSAFDIHFRVIDATTQAAGLTSACYQFFVR